MGGCSAINCSNHSRNKHRMFKFPTDPARRRIWTVNCRRDAWVPGPSAQLCSAHFEESQFEQNRADKWKKLKQTAIPTLFDVPNPPPVIGPIRVKGIGQPKPGTLLQAQKIDKPQESENLRQKIADLEAENKRLIEEVRDKDNSLRFLTVEQKKFAKINKKSIGNWSQEGVVQALKLRFALGKFGYNYLRNTGYPCPSYSTLNRRIQHINLHFGVLRSIINIFKAKVDTMSENDKWCSLMIDEMEISKHKDFDVANKCFVGNVTLGNKAAAGNHYTVVLLRGIKSPWKQVIAHEVTGPSTSGEEMRNLVSGTIEACHSIGLKIKAMVSDMGSNNKALWKSFDVKVSRTDRSTFYTFGNDGERIHVMADVPHLIKNLRNSMLTRPLTLPESIRVREQLPNEIVSAGFIKQLWINEINADSCLRSLHHLNREHLFPTHFGCMNVATAVQLFSIKTAAAVEKAVHLREISKEALTTAWWIRLVHQWFQMMTARHVKKGITIRNQKNKFEFLLNFIEIVQNMQFGKGWKPLQTGLILSTLSVINLATEAFTAEYTYFLPGRLTQDALENVFSQIRRKSGLKPTALQARRALKLICISQFIADLKGTNYDNEFDCHLLDISNTLDVEIENQDPQKCSENNILQSSLKPLTASEENDIYYIAGATLNGILKQKLCTVCRNSARTAVDNNLVQMPRHLTFLTEYANMGGLQEPTSGIYRICRETERELQHNKDKWIKDEISINKDNVENIKRNCNNVSMPECCNLKEKIINYYLVIRCKGITKHFINKAAHEASYGSASAAKR